MHGKRSFAAASSKAEEQERQVLPTGLTIEEMSKLGLEQQLLLIEETKYRISQTADREMLPQIQRKDSNPKRRKGAYNSRTHDGHIDEDAHEEDVTAHAEEEIEISGILDAGQPEDSAKSALTELDDSSRAVRVEFLEMNTSDAHIMVYSFGNAHQKLSILEELRPKFIILYDPDVEFVRRYSVCVLLIAGHSLTWRAQRIEAFQATCTEKIRVYRR